MATRKKTETAATKSLSRRGIAPAAARAPGSGPRTAGGFTWKALTLARWPDLETLFGPRGACGGCWCMWWRFARSEFERKKGKLNRRALRALVERGDVPGIVGYLAGEPVAWCAIAPREATPGLDRSRVLARIDDEPVWSVSCLFVRRDRRRSGLSRRMLRAAAEYARKQGARLVEGYPVEPRTGKAPDAFVWTGLAPAFRAEGFEEVERRSPTRPIFRMSLRPRRPRASSSRASARPR